MPDHTSIHDRYFPSQTETYPQIYAYKFKLKPDEIKVGLWDIAIIGLDELSTFSSVKDGIEIPDWNIDKKKE